MTDINDPDYSLKVAQGIVRSFQHKSPGSQASGYHETAAEDSEILRSGSDGAIEVMVTSAEDGIAKKHRFEDTFVLIGRSGDCDLSLADDRVSKRHAYLQKIFGRVVCVDLASRNGTYWPDGRRPFGWFDDEHAVSIGKYQLKLVPHAPPEEITDPEFDPGSFFKTDSPKPDIPKVSLQYLSDSGAEESWMLNRTITLVGSSSCCKLRLQHETVSRVHCSLILLPEGLWIVDLLGYQGTLVNKKHVRSVRLEDGDVFQVGKYAFQITYLPPDPVSRDSQALAHDHALAGKVISNEFAGQLVEQVMAMQQQFLQQSQQQTEMMLQFFGTLHAQQHELLSQELARVREIDKELRELREALVPRAGGEVSRSSRVDTATHEESRPESSPRLNHIRTVGPGTDESLSVTDLEDANWKLWKAAESDRQQSEIETAVEDAGIENTARPQNSADESAEVATAGDKVNEVEPADDVNVEIDNSTEPGDERLLPETEETGDETLQDADDVEIDQQRPQVATDHHAWVMSRMYELERERDGIFRKMMRAVFRTDS